MTNNHSPNTTTELTALARSILIAAIISPLLIVTAHPPILKDIHFLTVSAILFTTLVTLLTGTTLIYNALNFNRPL